MAKVWIEDGARHSERGRCHCRASHAGDRPVALVEVIRNEQRRVAEVLQHSSRRCPRHALERLEHLDAEPELPWMRQRSAPSLRTVEFSPLYGRVLPRSTLAGRRSGWPCDKILSVEQRDLRGPHLLDAWPPASAPVKAARYW